MTDERIKTAMEPTYPTVDRIYDGRLHVAVDENTNWFFDPAQLKGLKQDGNRVHVIGWKSSQTIEFDTTDQADEVMTDLLSEMHRAPAQGVWGQWLPSAHEFRPL